MLDTQDGLLKAIGRLVSPASLASSRAPGWQGSQGAAARSVLAAPVHLLTPSSVLQVKSEGVSCQGTVVEVVSVVATLRLDVFLPGWCVGQR